METQSLYQIERHDTLTQLDALEKEWTDLIAGIPDAPVFLTWEWIGTWWLYFGHDRELWLLTARDRQGSLVGLAPLMREAHRKGGVKLRTIAFIGTGLVFPVHLNILAHTSNQEEVLQAFLDYLFSQSDQWDVISLASVAQESSLINLLATGDGRIRTGSQVISPYIPLPGSWEIYLKTLNKKLRRNLRYFRSKLEDDYPGSVDFNCVTDSQELPVVMKKLEELNRNRWHADGLSSAFDDPAFCSFHLSMARLALDKGWLRLYQLTVLGRVIALYHCFRFHDRVYAYQMAFDIDWHGYSPGRLLIAYGIQSSIEEAACELDWLAGKHDYKLAWTDLVRVEYEILFSSNRRGGAWIKWKVFQEVLRAKVKQALPQSAQDRIQKFLSTRPRTTEGRSAKDGE